jgi:cytochrome c556
MPRVLSTDEAKASITRLSAIVNGPFTDEIANLETEGRTLSRPDVWDGPTAANFRSLWGNVEKNLAAFRADLDELRAHVQTVNANIMTAGGSVSV